MGGGWAFRWRLLGLGLSLVGRVSTERSGLWGEGERGRFIKWVKKVSGKWGLVRGRSGWCDLGQKETLELVRKL